MRTRRAFLGAVAGVGVTALAAAAGQRRPTTVCYRPPVCAPVPVCPPAPGTVFADRFGMRLAYIPAGSFLMGSPASDPDAHADERPQHLVTITRPFLAGAFEVTVGQFAAFVRATGYRTEGEANGKGSHGLDLDTGKVEPMPRYTWRTIGWPAEKWVLRDDYPVVCVSWADAVAFCRWLSACECATYRLPTEAEWEYACRAGTATRYFAGDAEATLRETANIADASLKAQWEWKTDDPPFPKGTKLPPWAKEWDDGHPFLAPVGRFRPNPWGLYDMQGNAGEWCSDWYDEKYYASSPVCDPTGPAVGPLVPIDDIIPGAKPRTLRVVRGGVWLDPGPAFRSADRRTHRRHPVDSAADIGFRVVREL